MNSDDIGAQRRLPDFDYADPDAIFFVTIHARSGLVPFADPGLADAVVGSLTWLRTHGRIILYASCLMPDRLHLLLRCPGTQTLGDVIRSMKLTTTRTYWQLGHRGQLWQDRFYDHVLRTSEDAAGIARYIYDNPRRKGLVEDPKDYPYTDLPDPM
jgi:REP-associated tyrosine transposase